MQQDTTLMDGLILAHTIQELRHKEANEGLSQEENLYLKSLISEAIDRYESGH